MNESAFCVQYVPFYIFSFQTKSTKCLFRSLFELFMLSFDDNRSSIKQTHHWDGHNQSTWRCVLENTSFFLVFFLQSSDSQKNNKMKERWKPGTPMATEGSSCLEHLRQSFGFGIFNLEFGFGNNKSSIWSTTKFPSNQTLWHINDTCIHVYFGSISFFGFFSLVAE